MQLSEAQKQEIYQEGFTVLRDAVPRPLIDAALRTINQSLGSRGMHPDKLPSMRAQTYCPEINDTAAITDLFNRSSLFSLCESALGEGNVPHMQSGQIALRFPNSESVMHLGPPHLDGVAAANNGVAPGEFHNFTCLVGVLLSDLPETNMGNFTSWPGTHCGYEKYFQKEGVDAFLQGVPQIELPDPFQMTGQAGDAVLCHHLLGHGIAPNLSPHIRYAVFFRISHRDHGSHRSEVLADMWRDWPGITAAVAS